MYEKKKMGASLNFFAPNFAVILIQENWFAVQKCVKKHVWNCHILNKYVSH